MIKTLLHKEVGLGSFCGPILMSLLQLATVYINKRWPEIGSRVFISFLKWVLIWSRFQSQKVFKTYSGNFFLSLP